MKLQNRMKVSIDPMAALFFAAMLLTDRTHVVGGIFLAATIHELGHLLAARLLHIPLRCLRLDLLGARLDVGTHMLGYGEEWALCAAGPIFSLLFAAGLLPFSGRSVFLQELAGVSLLLGILNLLPIKNFDGSRMLRSFLSATVGEICAERVERICSVFFVLLLWSLAVYFLLRTGDGLSLFFFSLGLFFKFFAFSDPRKQP